MDRMRIYPLTLRGDDENTEGRFRLLLRHFDTLPSHFKLIIVDSITLLVAHSDQVANVDFFSACKNLCDQGRTILLVAHSYAFDEEVLSRSRSLCDAHFRIKLEQMGDRLVKILEVLKVRGADRPTGDVVTFEVEPKVGMRIIPMSKARVYELVMSGLPFKLKECSQDCGAECGINITNCPGSALLPPELQERCQVSTHLL